MSGGEVGVEALDVGLEPRDVRVGHRRVARDRQLAAQVEQVVLDSGRGSPRPASGSGFGEQHADRRVELVDAADRVDARRVLGHARAVAQAGGAGVAGARHDLRQAMAHESACRGVEVRSSVTKSAGRGKPTAIRFATMRDKSDDRRRRRMNPYAQDLDRNDANYAPLTPLSFLARTAYIWPQRTRGHPRRAALHVAADVRALAAARVGAGAPRRRRPATRSPRCSPNTPEMFEAHFGVPMTGGVLNTLNTRLDAEAIAFMLDHGEAKVLLTDTEFAPVVEAALARVAAQAARDRRRRPGGPGRRAARRARLRGVHRGGRPGVRLAAARRRMAGDLAQLHLGHHRQSEGRRLPPPRRVPQRAVATSSTGACRATRSTCGRCRCSTATAGASRGRWPPTPAPTSACARSRRSAIFDAIREHEVTHYCGAPIVHSMLINAPDEMKAGHRRTRCRRWSPARRRRRR